MKIPRLLQKLTLAVALSCCLSVQAQSSFNSGSNGSFGPLILDATNSPNGIRTIALPPDGVLHCTTINVTSGYQLYFTKNAANTPVYLLATGDVTIDGQIFVSGEMNVGRRGGDGGPGGFPGGQGGTNPSNGFGPGGGKGGWGTPNTLPAGRSIRGSGGYATPGSQSGTGGPVYGNSLLIPLLGGSGGGGADDIETYAQYGGGGGGGAILVASNTKISFSSGFIFSYGGNASNSTGAGSGGAVRLVAPTVTGTGYLYVNGGQGGGFGRIRVDALTHNLNLSNTDSAGYATFGANMVVTPANLPELRITKAAGQDIALTQTDPVFVLLPAGAPPTQTIEVQAKNFNSVVPLVAVLTPEAGERTSYNFDINNTAGGATTGSVQVQIPAGVSTRVDVWTR
jgi:hypothetical protein